MYLVDQERLLDEAITSVKQAAFQMERCLDNGNVFVAIQYASDMLREMRTSFLSPKSYYELYIVVTEKLRLLESFLVEEYKCGRKVADIYEIVQYNPSIVPRLYLLITIGVCYIKCGECSRPVIMRDLVEMCSGVQHPIRGLFLRNYLLHALRSELLPNSEDCAPQSSIDHIENRGTTNGHSSLDVLDTQSVNSQGTLTDSVNFLLFNFAEMNKLWVRLQHQGHSRDRERREQERRELRLLVGTNLNRLSQLEAVDVARYQSKILPPILEQLLECHDVIAQEYLMDVVIQVFPDDFHLATLPALLTTCGRLQSGVKPRPIVCSLIERLSQYAANQLRSGGSLIYPVIPTDSTNGPSSNDSQTLSPRKSVDDLDSAVSVLFTVFFHGVGFIVNECISASEQSDVEAGVPNQLELASSMTANGLPPEDIPAMYAALVYFVMVLYPEHSISHVNACLNSTADILDRIGIHLVTPSSPLSRELLNLLHMPLGGSFPHPSSSVSHKSLRAGSLEATGDLRTVLNMTGFRRLVTLLDSKTTKCRLACNLLAGALEHEQYLCAQKSSTSVPRIHESKSTSAYTSCRLTTEADVDSLFELIGGLITPEFANPEDPDEFAEIQGLVAGALHLLGPVPQSGNPNLCYRLLNKAQHWLNQAPPAVIRFNFPALIFESLRLLQAYDELSTKNENWDEDVQNTVALIHRCVVRLMTTDSSSLALRLFLKAALVIDRIAFSKREALSYEFISQALTLYEEELSDARAQIDAISLISGTLCQMRCFDEDDRNTLRTQCTRAAAHLLRKHDQSRAVAAAAHFFWPVPALERNNVKPTVLTSLTDKAEAPCMLRPQPDVPEEQLAKLRDSKSVVSCLDRAVALADESMDTAIKAQLYLNILNHSISLRLVGCLEITDEHVNSLFGKAKKMLADLHPSAVSEEINRHLVNTAVFLNDRRGPEGTTGLFSEVKL